MAAKAQAESHAHGSTGRRREILGIVLLALGLFSALAMTSTHAGSPQMMGPGGAATAAGLYALLGVASYLFIGGMLVTAWRAFRGSPLVDGFVEGVGSLMLLGAVTVLLHLPFAGGRHLSHGPGGLAGQYLGEVIASFIGSVGAALAATALLFMGLLLVTDIQMKEVAVVTAWGAKKARAGTWMGLQALGRLAVAMFPERETQAARALEPVSDGERDGDEDAARSRRRRLAPVIPAVMRGDDTDGVRVGHGRLLDDGEDMRTEETDAPRVDARRAAMSAILAEVAAVERLPAAEQDSASDTDDDAAADGHAAATVEREEITQSAEALVIAESPASANDGAGGAAALGPIIVEPAWRTRMREREQARQDVRDGKDKDKDDSDDVARGPSFIKLKAGAYQLPATDLLEYLPPQGNDTDKQGLYDMAERLEHAMANYGVRGKVKEIHMGPVVTMFEFAPEPGTRTGKIANLEKDLAMALEAQAVRILAPIPGKSVVGVEVPNKTREMVYLREILEDDCFTKANSKLQVALGKDIKGAPVSVNLAKMPHLLVAGTTGSGKSVAVNGMIVSLLYNASPEEVRFIMVDPKMLELSIYEGIPHLLLPVVTDPKKANLALRWAVEEMERRYELLARAGVRDVASYNAKLGAANPVAPGAAKGSVASPVSAEAAAAAVPGKKRLKVMITGPDGTEQEMQIDPDDAATPVAEALAPALADGAVVEPMDPDDVSAQQAAAQASRDAAASPSEAQPPSKLPYIVIVIDEFADLMMVAPKDVETSVARIAQKARAAGLHLILATQRPSVDVITGLIKANFPSRIALPVASRIDSRTILDQPGADTLLGNGDMLFSDRGLKLRRLHGAFLSDDEVHRVVDHLKTQAKPVYDMDILKPREEDAEEGGAPADDFHDELYDQAVAIVCETRQASVSYIQRRLQIGYNRSARLVEQMERDGIVGPANGAKAREVLAPPGEYLLQAG